MARRNREINIFNMSLLDILCGALGAFCFMMLTLLPYYKPPTQNPDLVHTQREMDDVMRQLDELKKQMSNPQSAQQMQQLIQQMQQQVQQMEGQLNKALSDNQQLQQNQEKLKKDAAQKDEQLSNRQPFIVQVSANELSQNVDLYLLDNFNANPPTAPFDPRVQHQSSRWTGDIHFWRDGRAEASWLVRDSPPGVVYKLFVKLTNEPAQRGATSVRTEVINTGETSILSLPEVTLTPERPWMLLGTLTSKRDATPIFNAATDAEREAEQKAAPQGTPFPTPKPTPTSAASASPTATAAAASTPSPTGKPRRFWPFGS